MIEKNFLQSVRQWAAGADDPVLSVYLNVDPSDEKNLNQGYLTRFKTGVRKIAERLAHDEAELERFRRVAGALEKELEDYKPDAKALAIFQTPHGLDWRCGVRVKVRECVDWTTSPLLEPMVEMLDEHERYGVALVDRGRARLFAAHLGEIEEMADLFGGDVARARATGADQLWSARNNQRRAEEHASRHARQVAQALAEADREQGFDRILLLGGGEARDKVAAELSRRLERKLAGSEALDMSAKPADVLRAIEEVHARVERAEEIDLVGRMMTLAAKNGPAVAGLQETVEALGQGRIRELVVSGNFHPHWDQLEAPAPWLHEADGAADDLLERMLDHTASTGGRIELVWGQAAEQLEREAGGVGAMLRY